MFYNISTKLKFPALFIHNKFITAFHERRELKHALAAQNGKMLTLFLNISEQLP